MPAKLEVFRASPDYEVVGIVEPDAELRGRAEATEAFRGLPWMTQEQLLNTPGLQMVLVETRVHDLLNAAEACVAAGKHVHLDKPAGAVAAAIQAHSRRGRQQEPDGADGLHVPLQPGRRDAARLSRARLAGRALRSTRRDEQSRRRHGAARTGRVSRRHHVRAGLPRHRPGRRRAWPAAEGHSVMRGTPRQVRRYACSTICWPCSSIRGPPPP